MDKIEDLHDEKKAWHDLYWHGQNLAYNIKALRTKFKHAVEEDDEEKMLIWVEAIRKQTVNCVDIAKTVLGVEEIVKGRKIVA